MIRKPLVATRRRAIWAALYGIATPPVFFLGWVIVREVSRAPGLASLSQAMSGADIAIVVMVGVSALIFGLFGVPIWLLLHRRRARWPVAALSGLCLGALVPVSGSLFFGVGSLTGANLWREVAGNLPFVFGGAAIGGLTGLGVWLIAYRRAPTGDDVAVVFS